MGDELVVRRAEAADQARLVALDERAARTAVSRSWVAERGARLVGYAVTSDAFFGRAFVELVFVAAGARRSGVGSALLDAVEDAVRADRLFISTNESNAPMRTLLLRRGYVASGRIENLDDGDPELVLVKFLLREQRL